MNYLCPECSQVVKLGPTRKEYVCHHYYTCLDGHNLKYLGDGNFKWEEDDIRHQAHYEKLKIQPVEFIGDNDLDYFQGSIITYVVRYKDKNGLEDLKKARHFLDMLIIKVETGKTKV